MRKNLLKRWSIIGLLIISITMVITGCSVDNSADNKDADKEEEVLYPISINDKEILVGETTVQTLLDDGFKITVSEMTPDKQINEYEVDPETELEANTYYSGGSVWITDSTFAHISFTTDENAVRMGDAVIARMEFNISSREEGGLDNIKFNGVPISEISREKAGEMFPDFTGDENMWLKYGLDYDYFMSFSSENKMLNKFSVERNYDVDWSSSK